LEAVKQLRWPAGMKSRDVASRRRAEPPLAELLGGAEEEGPAEAEAAAGDDEGADVVDRGRLEGGAPEPSS